jgi:hypothetical protein
MTQIPNDPDQYLDDKQLSVAFAQKGIPVAVASLRTHVTRGGGPEYVKFGRRRLYRWGPALAWASAKMTAPVRSSSELPQPPAAA